MNGYSLGLLLDHDVRSRFHAAADRHRATTAELLACLGEFDSRQLYLPAAHGSMRSYCVGELHMSEDTALKRIRVARVAREYPAIFPALADGRLSLSAVLLLKPRLTRENAAELLAYAAHKTNAQVEQLLAERFPRADVPTLIEAVIPADVNVQLAVRPLQDNVNPLAARPVEARATVTPLAPQRYALQVTVGEATHDKLRHARALLGHAVPTGDLAQVLDRTLDALIERLEKRKFAAAVRTRPRRGSPRGRYIPAEIRRQVCERDGGQCTFVAENGRRCEERSRLEFDHVTLVARGGEASVDSLRLRCRAHNQYTAEQTLGAGFMKRKREEARARTHARVPAERPNSEAHDDVARCLKTLGFRRDEVLLGVARGAELPDATLEQQIKATLSVLGPRTVTSRFTSPHPLG